MSDTGPDPRDTATPDEPTTPASGADHALEETLVARVRADDPASTAVPDAPALRAAVEQRLAAGSVDQLAARRRRRMWIPVAAAAAGALVLGGGGGYAIGASGADDTKNAAVAELGAQEDSAGAVAGPVAPQPAPGPGSSPQAGGGRDGMAAGADSTMRGGYGGWGGRTVFTAQGLPDQGGTATVYALDAASAYSAERLGAVASALGVTAPVAELEGGVLQAGPGDGSGATVSMYVGDNASISYYDPAKDPWTCPADGAECTQRDLGAPPSFDEAQAQLAAVLTAAGLDASQFAYESQSYGDAAWTYVVATRLVDGQSSDLAWNGTWTGAGLQSVYGSIAPVVSLGSYEVISPTQAVARLGDPRFGASSGPILYAEDTVGGDAVSTPAAPAPDQPSTPTIPTTPTPGSKLSWSVTQVTIVSFELTLATQWQPDGGILLAPTYELTGSDGSVWSVIAVADGSLDFS